MTPLQIPSATLANGITMPRLVFGTYQIKDPKICQKAVEDALEAGYRAIDTAQSYGNEAAVGAALKACGLPRSELFITTKLWVEDASEAGARRAALRSMELLGLDYLDLYLIHQPVGDVFGAWRTIEALYREDLLRAVGVSNFSPDRLMDMALSSTIRPQVNQVEINPFASKRMRCRSWHRWAFCLKPGRHLPRAETDFSATQCSPALQPNTTHQLLKLFWR